MSPYDFARRNVLDIIFLQEDTAYCNTRPPVFQTESSTALLLKRILAIVRSGLESSQMHSRIKILCYTAVKAFLNGLL